MAANPKRGEVSFPSGGKGAFFYFTLSDGEAMEAQLGEGFFEKVELAAHNGGMSTMLFCIRLGLKKRGADGKCVLLAEDAEEFDFHWRDAVPAVLDAASLLVFNLTYTEVVAKAVEAQKKLLAEQVKELKEAADAAGHPLSEEVLVTALSKSLSGQG